VLRDDSMDKKGVEEEARGGSGLLCLCILERYAGEMTLSIYYYHTQPNVCTDV
jgi:hypothetical protein